MLLLACLGLQGGGVSPPLSQRLLPGGTPLPERGHLHGAVGAVRVRHRTGRLERRVRLHSRHVRVLRAASCKIPANAGIWDVRVVFMKVALADDPVTEVNSATFAVSCGFGKGGRMLQRGGTNDMFRLHR